MTTDTKALLALFDDSKSDDDATLGAIADRLPPIAATMPEWPTWQDRDRAAKAINEWLDIADLVRTTGGSRRTEAKAREAVAFARRCAYDLAEWLDDTEPAYRFDQRERFPHE